MHEYSRIKSIRAEDQLEIVRFKFLSTYKTLVDEVLREVDYEYREVEFRNTLDFNLQRQLKNNNTLKISILLIFCVLGSSICSW